MKYLNILLAVSALVLAGACEKESTDSASQSGTLTAVIEGSDLTRTAYNSNSSGAMSWSPGDQIALHRSNGSYYTASISNASTGAFSCPETASAYRDYYAVYPASCADGSNYGNTTLKITLPASYDITAKTSDYAPLPLIAINDTHSTMLTFRHACGLFRITCNGVPAGTKTVRVTFDRDVTGSFSVDTPKSDKPVIRTTGATSRNTVSFVISSSGLSSQTNGIVLNVPIPCGEYRSVRLDALNTGGTSIGNVTNTTARTVLRRHGQQFTMSF